MRYFALCSAAILAFALTSPVVASAGDLIPTVTVVHDTPGVVIEGEVSGLGAVALNILEEGVTGGVWWASLEVVADVGQEYDIRVRARSGTLVSPWSAWRTFAGPPPGIIECGSMDGAIGIDEIGLIMDWVGRVGDVCLLTPSNP